VNWWLPNAVSTDFNELRIWRVNVLQRPTAVRHRRVSDQFCGDGMKWMAVDRSRRSWDHWIRDRMRLAELLTSIYRTSHVDHPHTSERWWTRGQLMNEKEIGGLGGAIGWQPNKRIRELAFFTRWSFSIANSLPEDITRWVGLMISSSQ